MAGTPAGEIDAKLQTILHGADPPVSEASVADLLDRATFGDGEVTSCAEWRCLRVPLS
jgi:hypothetical protein